MIRIIAILVVLLSGSASYAHPVTELQDIIVQRAALLGHPITKAKARHIAQAIISNDAVIPRALTIATIEIESKYDLTAKSSKNCQGLMQLSPRTAEFIAARLGIKNHKTYNVTQNIQMGTWYLAKLIKKHKSQARALTVYNMGEGNYIKNKKRVSNYAKLVLKRHKKIRSLLKSRLTRQQQSLTVGGES